MTKPKTSRFLWLIISLCLISLSTWFLYRLTFRQTLERYTELLAPHTQGELNIRWFGTAAIALDDGKTSIFVDPYFSRIPLKQLTFTKISPDAQRIRYWLDKAHIHKLDAVLVSHSHFDHALDAPFIAKETGAIVYGSESTANIALGQGLTKKHIQVIKPEIPLHIGDFTITFIQSRHGGNLSKPSFITKPLPTPAFAYQYQMGEVYSILIEHPKGSFLHHASAGYIPNTLKKYHADNVFLGIALDTDTHVYIENVVKAVRAKTVYPIHWDDFFIPLESPLKPLPFGVNLNGFLTTMQSDFPDIKVKTLPVETHAPH